MNTQKGYTVAEWMMAIFIFGLIISFMMPLFQQIVENAKEQSIFVESSQWMVTQMERLAPSCVSDQKGTDRRKIAKSNTTVQMKWECKKINHGLIYLSVEVQWKNQKGELKKQKVETHRFRTNKDLPI